MATLSQVEANRLNSQRSTGPRTPQGKAVSSQNAFKSGLDADSQFCYGEQRTDFYRLQIEYFTRFQPRAPEERFQVDSLIRNEWMLRRLFRAEAHLPEIGFVPEISDQPSSLSANDQPSTGESGGQAPSPAPDPPVRLSEPSQNPELGFVPESASSASGPANPGRSRLSGGSRASGKPCLWQPRAS